MEEGGVLLRARGPFYRRSQPSRRTLARARKTIDENLYTSRGKWVRVVKEYSHQGRLTRDGRWVASWASSFTIPLFDLLALTM